MLDATMMQKWQELTGDEKRVLLKAIESGIAFAKQQILNLDKSPTVADDIRLRDEYVSYMITQCMVALTSLGYDNARSKTRLRWLFEGAPFDVNQWLPDPKQVN